MAKPKVVSHPYENNPFFIGLNGLKLFFANAQSVAIYAIVLAVIGFIFGFISNIVDIFMNPETNEAGSMAQKVATERAVHDFFSQPVDNLVIIGVLIASVIFMVIVIHLLLYGVLEYTAGRMAHDERVTLGDALKHVGSELASYIWMNILLFLKLLGWTLLFIVPGIIMAIRYSLSGTVFFAEGKRGNAAIKRSAELTKGAWFTTFAGSGLWNIMTFNQIGSLLLPGTNALMYRQLRDVTDAGKPKPPAHWLSWVTFFVPVALVVLFILFAAFILVVIAVASGR